MKKVVGLFLTIIMVLGVFLSVPVTVSAASVDYLTFELNEETMEYSVIRCDESVGGEITIPETYNGLPVTEIAEYAFMWCNITGVKIPDSVTNVDNSSFQNCKNLTSITIPNSVTSIGCRAFWGCDGLKTITIPCSVISIGEEALSYCNNLTAIDVNSKNTCYASVDGVLFNKRKTMLVQYPNGKDTRNYTNPDSIGNYTIPDSVVSIGNYAFYDVDCLEAIIIPNSVTHIGDSAFFSCDGLTSIIIPDNVKTINAYAFEYCANLSSITISDNVSSIGSSAFFGSEYYENTENWDNGVLYVGNHLIEVRKEIGDSYEIKNGTRTISALAFWGCDGLIKITIPSSVVSIGEEALSSCNNLTTINVDSENNCYTSVDGVLLNKEKTLLLKYPNGKDTRNYTIPDSVITIGKYAFSDANKLEHVVIPNSVTSIGEGAFSSCDGLVSIIIPDSVISIGDFAFFECKRLKTVTIPDSVTDFGLIAFGYVNGEVAAYERIESFVICGVEDSNAEIYAEENGFSFVPVLKSIKPVFKSVRNVNDYVKVTWGKVSGADSYRVYRKVSRGSYEYIGSTTNTSYIDKKAPAGKTCRYRIRAKNEAGYSVYSASLAIKHIDEPTLKSIENSAYGVLIKWDKVSGAEKYSVYRKVSGGEYEYIGATTNAYYTDKTAKSGKKYYYAIRGKRDDSVSSQSASLSKYHLADPTLNTPTTTTKGVGLRWSKVTGAEGYMVYRRTASGSYTRITTEKGVENVTFRDTTAKKGTKYYYKVKAYKSKTYSAYSNTKSIIDKY